MAAVAANIGRRTGTAPAVTAGKQDHEAELIRWDRDEPEARTMKCQCEPQREKYALQWASDSFDSRMAVNGAMTAARNAIPCRIADAITDGWHAIPSTDGERGSTRDLLRSGDRAMASLAMGGLGNRSKRPQTHGSHRGQVSPGIGATATVKQRSTTTGGIVVVRRAGAVERLSMPTQYGWDRHQIPVRPVSASALRGLASSTRDDVIAAVVESMTRDDDLTWSWAEWWPVTAKVADGNDPTAVAAWSRDWTHRHPDHGTAAMVVSTATVRHRVRSLAAHLARRTGSVEQAHDRATSIVAATILRAAPMVGPVERGPSVWSGWIPAGRTLGIRAEREIGSGGERVHQLLDAEGYLADARKAYLASPDEG
jgi:hypothetical protein